jgi:hypothetical protein
MSKYNIKSQRCKLNDLDVIEIYRKVVEKKEKYGTPYSLSLRTYGITSWSSFKEKVDKLQGRIEP